MTIRGIKSFPFYPDPEEPAGIHVSFHGPPSRSAATAAYPGDIPMRPRHLFPLSILCGLVMIASPVLASTMYVATLDGSLECPPVVTPATGFGTFVLNAAETQLTIHVEYAGLQGAQTDQHIHNAPIGACGGVAFALPAGGSPIDIVWNIPAAMVTELKAGRLYVNIHSTFKSGGEIRGQIMPGPTKIEPGSWGRIKLLYR